MNGQDSTASVTIKEKPSIRPCIYFNRFGSRANNRMDSSNQYSYRQNNIGFYVPLYTETWIKDDKISVSSIHILGGVDYINYIPKFSFIDDTLRLSKFSTNLKLFWANGSKNVWFFQLSPFVSKQFNTVNKRYSSSTFTIIYNRTVSEKFAYRLGITGNYTFGRFLPIPILGLRIGKLDKIHANLQFPRNLSLEIPINKTIQISIFNKSFGGIYAISLKDTLRFNTEKRILLGRYEILHGVQSNFKINNHFSLYVGLGFTNKRHLNFTFQNKLSENIIKDKNKIPPSLLVTFGFAIRIGKAKQHYNDSNMYNLFEMNTSMGSNHKDAGTYDTDIPTPSDSKIGTKKLQYKDVEDLITDEY
ncbi:MAG: DUF6268 family outer membrane beta-barrel protein [Cytophagales bacterium]